MSSRPRKLADPAMPAVAPTCVTAALERVGRPAPVSNGALGVTEPTVMHEYARWPAPPAPPACECYRIVRYGYERALTRTAGLTLRRTDGKGSEAATRATSSRFVADQWPEAEPEE
jgi:hypothetical protein